MARFPLHKDPQAHWEMQKYDNPIPSRQYILRALEALKGPTSDLDLAKAFGIYKQAERLEAFQHRLMAMQRDGQLIQNRRGDFGLVSKMHLLQGTVIGHKEGFGFLAPDDGSGDIFLSFRQMQIVFDGDRVLARVKHEDRKGRRNAVIVEVLERNTKQLVGRYYYESGVGFVVPDNKRITHNIIVAPQNAQGAQTGQCVLAEITLPPDFKRQAHGKILEILGDIRTSGIETDMAIRTFDIPFEWPQAVTQEVSSLGPEVLAQDKVGRVDLTALPLVTIDGEDAQDFDDAVYCERKPSGGFRLLVAIADVSHYVLTDSNLDQEAHKRGNSVYFPNRVIPMLPEVLSNGLCSLKPQVDRLCMVCELHISTKGKVARYRFFEGLMCSQARLTYTQVHAYLSRRDFQYSSTLSPALELEPVRESLSNLYELFQKLRQTRQERGSIDFDTKETKILFNNEGKIDNIVATSRNDAHRLIEECMLLANTAAAKLLQKMELPVLYRIHEQPKEEKITLLNQFLASLGLQLPKRKHLQAKDFQAVLRKSAGRPDERLIQTVLLRSMQQAQYSADPMGHFGLAYPIYAHFTSPIRRYPDLMVHRALRYLIRSRLETPHVQRVPGVKRVPKKQWLQLSAKKMHTLGEHCSATERRADEATRDAYGWLKCEYMQDRVGEIYKGLVSGVVPFGLFVELKDIFVEGLVHVSALPSDYYTHDEVHHRLVGQRSGRYHGLGDEICVRLAKVDLDDRKIDFELLDNYSHDKRGLGSKRAKKDKGVPKGRGKVNMRRERAASSKKRKKSKKKSN